MKFATDPYDMIEAIRKRDVTRADKLAHDHTRHFHDRFVRFMSANYSEDFDFDLSTREGSAISRK